MTSHLGQLVRRSRERLRLRPADVALKTGLGNSAKTFRRLAALEERGETSEDLLTHVMSALNIEPEAVRAACDEDMADYQHFLDEPIPPRLVVRIAGVFAETALPGGATTGEVIALAVAKSREMPTQTVYLTLSRREQVVVKNGEPTRVFERDGIAPPSTRVGGRAFGGFLTAVPTSVATRLHR